MVHLCDQLDPASVPPSVTVTSDGTPAMLVLAATLSSDGKTLSIPFGALPPLPVRLTVALDPSMTDLAGNHLVPAPWSFSVAPWIQLGATLPGATHVAAGAADVVFASHVDLGASSGWGVTVRRFSGGAWQDLPPLLNPISATNPFIADGALAVDGAGQPLLLYSYPSPPGSNFNSFHVARLNEPTMSWDLLGGAIMVGPGATSLTVDASGAILVAYSQNGVIAGNPPLATDGLYVLKWDGSTWQMIASALRSPDATGMFGEPQVASDGRGHMAVSFAASSSTWTKWAGTAFVDVWDGRGFEYLKYPNGALGFQPYASQPVGSPRLALDGMGFPVIAFTAQDPSGATNLFVYRGDRPGCTELTGEPANIGGPVAIAVDSQSRPVVLYHDTAATPNALVIRWSSASGWTPLGTDPVAVGLNQPLVIDRHDRVLTSNNGAVLRSNQ
jgi:hypothetical protein